MAINTYGGAGQGRSTLSSALVGRSVPTGDPGNFWKDLDALSRLRPRTPAAPARVQAETLRAPTTMAAARPSLTPNEQLLNTMEQGARMAELQALTQPPPLKQVGLGPQQIPGWQIDTEHLTGAQRKVYLPQNSQMVGAAGPSPASLDSAGQAKVATNAPVTRADSSDDRPDWYGTRGRLAINQAEALRAQAGR